MKQIILLRWWQAKENYKSYKDFVTKYEIDPYAEKYIKWSDLLWDTVKNKYKNIDFIEIERFNKLFADYEIRKIVFEKYINFIKNNSIFVAHSLGWTFF